MLAPPVVEDKADAAETKETANEDATIEEEIAIYLNGNNIQTEEIKSAYITESGLC